MTDLTRCSRKNRCLAKTIAKIRPIHWVTQHFGARSPTGCVSFLARRAKSFPRSVSHSLMNRSRSIIQSGAVLIRVVMSSSVGVVNSSLRGAVMGCGPESSWALHTSVLITNSEVGRAAVGVSGAIGHTSRR